MAELYYFVMHETNKSWASGILKIQSLRDSECPESRDRGDHHSKTNIIVPVVLIAPVSVSAAGEQVNISEGAAPQNGSDRVLSTADIHR